MIFNLKEQTHESRYAYIIFAGPKMNLGRSQAIRAGISEMAPKELVNIASGTKIPSACK